MAEAKPFDLDLSPYAGHWVALVRGRVAGVGRTSDKARKAAQVSRSKETPELRFVTVTGKTFHCCVDFGDSSRHRGRMHFWWAARFAMDCWVASSMIWTLSLMATQLSWQPRSAVLFGVRWFLWMPNVTPHARWSATPGNGFTSISLVVGGAIGLLTCAPSLAH